jgi:NADH:ubiquinone oxidoreductase subunit K
VTPIQFSHIAGIVSLAVFVVSVVGVLLPTRSRISHVMTAVVSGGFTYVYLGYAVFNQPVNTLTLRTLVVLAIAAMGSYVFIDVLVTLHRRSYKK